MLKASIHPFPARMAPELALEALARLKGECRVLDPMTGSGTVARQAVGLGHTALGFDLDPLAVLISKVSTTPVDDEEVAAGAELVLAAARSLDPECLRLPWIDDDEATSKFIDFWFGQLQRRDLRRIAYILHNADSFELAQDVADVLRVAMSRIIVTKKQCASLAQDTSHSRPHRVSLVSNYDVLKGFEMSARAVRRRLSLLTGVGKADIRHGDARCLGTIADDTIDAVLTSPPYLNAIDYLRGHRLSLVWLGHGYGSLSAARSASIGSERRPDRPFDESFFSSAKIAVGDVGRLPRKHQAMIERYLIDLHQMISEVARVLKSGAEATFVMGNSCLKGVYIQNSEALVAVAGHVGLQLSSRTERDLPSQHRYLPTPAIGALGKRMRKEIILTFTK